MSLKRAEIWFPAGAQTLKRPNRPNINIGGAPSRVPFPSSDPFYTAIPSSPVLDSASSAMSATWNSGLTPVMDIYEFGCPIYEIPAGSTFTGFTGTVAGSYYGAHTITCRIPANAAPSPGSDGACAIIDWDLGYVYEFWVLRKTGGVWVSNTCAKFPISSKGLGRLDSVDGADGVVGAGFSRALGVLTQADLVAGYPNGDAGHALIFATPFSEPTSVRYPAQKTDGANTGGFTGTLFPEGARIQIDPAYDVNGSSMSNIQKFITRTLQKYGAYIMDNGGGRAPVLICQGNDPSLGSPPTDPGNPTNVGGWARTYGVSYDYWGLPNIPWSQLRVLKKFDGSA